MFSFNKKQLSVVTEEDVGVAYQNVIAFYLLKIFIVCGWYRRTWQNKVAPMFRDELFCELTGLDFEPESGSGSGCDTPVSSNNYSNFTNKQFRKLLTDRLSEIADEGISTDLPLFVNVETLANIIGLSEVEKRLLIIATALAHFSDLRNSFPLNDDRDGVDNNYKILSTTLNYPEREIRAALHSDAVLASSGLLSLSEDYGLFEYMFVLSEGIGELLLQENLCKDDIANRFLIKSSSPCLELSAFPHLAKDIQVLMSYLSESSASKEQGTNILLYGMPGTGKTQLARALAAALQVSVYEIAITNNAKEPKSGSERLTSFNLCQLILANQPHVMLIFDDVDDIFNKGANSEKEKAWINRSLEMSTTPTIWITNDANIDPAYLRRFDHSIKFQIPPQPVRQEIARHHLRQFNPTDAWLTRIAANDQVSPSQLDRAAKVARIAATGSDATALDIVVYALEHSATLLRQKRAQSRNVMHTVYDLGLINTDLPVAKLIDALKIKPSGTFCLYGPPGTGKSEFARYLADEIGKPLLLRRASDILCMWVGETEQNIADMFSEARQQDAVLVLDDADSFLADRRGANRIWEVTQVNELLNQMEAFNGIFVCTTNLMERLDQASLRRFAFKVKFDYLSSDQRWAMFLQELARMGGDVGKALDCEQRVRGLDTLTPGDFAVVSRQVSMLREIPTAEAVYEALRKECGAKVELSKAIGFLQ